MESNRDLLKEAIADAKAVKETALAQAKVALEEAFTPFLKETLATRIAALDEVDEVDENMYEEEEGMYDGFCWNCLPEEDNNNLESNDN